MLRFQNPVVSKQFAKVTDIHFCPLAPHDFAVTSSTRVQMFDGNSGGLKKTVTRFKDVAYSGSYRAGGHAFCVVCVSCTAGVLSVCAVR